MLTGRSGRQDTSLPSDEGGAHFFGPSRRSKQTGRQILTPLYLMLFSDHVQLWVGWRIKAGIMKHWNKESRMPKKYCDMQDLCDKAVLI